MSHDRSFARLHDTLKARFPGVPVGATAQVDKLHLYHAANSICSQKVRTVLMQTGRAWVSHPLNIFEGENYDPAYVHLRLAGCASAGLGLARQHLGTTSVDSSGCDACVVPTLVDAEEERVLIDSRRICVALDRANPKYPGALMPVALRDRIEAEIAIVDELPNYPLLAAGVGRAEESGPANSFSVAKVARCDALLVEHSDDPALCAAYAAKRSKEQMAADRLFDEEALQRARLAMLKALRDLECRLGTDEGAFLFGETITMADVFWGIELIRHDDLGLSPFWIDGRLPRVAKYFEKTSALPAIADAVVGWPQARLKRRPELDASMVEVLNASLVSCPVDLFQ